MSSVALVIEPRVSDLGEGFLVKRALPFSKKRMVGPFIFLDHMGPAIFTKEKPLLVRSHPHIGLSTLTYLFKGEMLHRDSLGNELVIRPGEVNWMTAGRGIAHSERSFFSSDPMHLEGIQLWIALPKESEEISPSFIHVSEDQLPKIPVGNSEMKLIAGSAFNESSPVPVYSPLFYLGGTIAAGDRFELDVSANAEGAVYISQGEIEVEETLYRSGQMICFTPGHKISFKSQGCQVVVLGGEIFPEKRFIFWNFVSSSQERIEVAKLDWQKQKFGQVINETDFIPLPG